MQRGAEVDVPFFPMLKRNGVNSTSLLQRAKPSFGPGAVAVFSLPVIRAGPCFLLPGLALRQGGLAAERRSPVIEGCSNARPETFPHKRRCNIRLRNMWGTFAILHQQRGFPSKKACLAFGRFLAGRRFADRPASRRSRNKGKARPIGDGAGDLVRFAPGFSAGSGRVGLRQNSRRSSVKAPPAKPARALLGSLA